MMKKILLTGLVIGALFMGMSINSFDGTTKEVTDEYIMKQYISENYGSECYGTFDGLSDEEHISFIVYEDDEPHWGVNLNRDYYTRKYTN